MAQNGLLDFPQGASNAAASNLSAPVDGIAWLLRKAGIPVPEAPVGGSDWMAQKGLTVQPQNQLAGLLGESVGGVAPIVAAAKAPQIARGLLQVEANAATPSTIPRMSERGVIVLGNAAEDALPSEKAFYNTYAQHIDLKGRQTGKSLANRDAILADGFKKGGNVNAIPPVTGTPRNIVERNFSPRAGDVVYFAPKGAWKNAPNGMEVQSGWVPKPWESVVVGDEDVGKPMYELLKQALERQRK